MTTMEVFHLLGPDGATLLLLVLGSLTVVAVFTLVCIGMSQSYFGRKQRIAAELVSEMLAAGYSAKDVERTLECAGFYERSAAKDFVRDLGTSLKAKAGVPTTS